MKMTRESSEKEVPMGKEGKVSDPGQGILLRMMRPVAQEAEEP